MKAATMIVGMLLLMAWPAQAQESGQSNLDEPSPDDPLWYLSNRTSDPIKAPVRRSSWSWDFGALYRFSGDTYYPGNPYQDNTAPKYFFSLDLARLHPGRSRNSHGFNLGFAAESDSWRVGLGYRFRKELGQGQYLELTPGILVVDSASQSDVQWPGYTAQLGLGLSRYFGFVLRVDSRRKEVEDYDWEDTSDYPRTVKYQWTDTSWYGGLRLSSHVGMGATFAGGLIIGGLAILASGW